MKDSGNRSNFTNGMVREVDLTKPAFNLLLPKGIPYEEQMLTRFGSLMQKGALKYSDRNWELGVGEEELERAKQSAFRHLMQYLCGEEDEDHAAAVFFNIMQAEYIAYKLKEENGT
jgi:dATP/dGTP diphosphohydrolase